MADIQHELLIRAFKILYSIFKFKESDIDATIFYGTLLGFFRDRDFIRNDDDIDILLSYTHYSKILDIIEKNSDKLIIRNHFYRFISVGLILDEELFKIPIDFYFYEEDPKNSTKILIAHEGLLFYNKEDILPQTEAIFYDQPILIPRNTNQILRSVYGTNYMIPTSKSYNWFDITEVNVIQLKEIISMKDDDIYKHYLEEQIKSQRNMCNVLLDGSIYSLDMKSNVLKHVHKFRAPIKPYTYFKGSDITFIINSTNEIETVLNTELIKWQNKHIITARKKMLYT